MDRGCVALPSLPERSNARAMYGTREDSRPQMSLQNTPQDRGKGPPLPMGDLVWQPWGRSNPLRSAPDLIPLDFSLDGCNIILFMPVGNGFN